MASLYLVSHSIPRLWQACEFLWMCLCVRSLEQWGAASDLDQSGDAMGLVFAGTP
jgi:hypothetical protein